MILVVLAALSKAVMDVIRFHFSKSIFANLNENYWNPNVSYANKNNVWYKLLKQAPDAWHNFQSLMIICICIAIGLNDKLYFESVMYNILLLGFVWNVVFNIFYGFILRKKV